MTPRQTAIIRLAANWGEKHPELTARLEKAVFLADVVRQVGPGTYEVPGNQGTYLVRVRGMTSTCTCPDDHARRTSHCKHRLAVALWVKTLERDRMSDEELLEAYGQVAGGEVNIKGLRAVAEQVRAKTLRLQAIRERMGGPTPFARVAYELAEVVEVTLRDLPVEAQRVLGPRMRRLKLALEAMPPTEPRA